MNSEFLVYDTMFRRRNKNSLSMSSSKADPVEEESNKKAGFAILFRRGAKKNQEQEDINSIHENNINNNSNIIPPYPDSDYGDSDNDSDDVDECDNSANAYNHMTTPEEKHIAYYQQKQQHQQPQPLPMQAFAVLLQAQLTSDDQSPPPKVFSFLPRV